MGKVMTAEESRKVRVMLEGKYRLSGERLEDAMNAVRRDRWERDDWFPRATAVVAPNRVASGLYGVSE